MSCNSVCWVRNLRLASDSPAGPGTPVSSECTADDVADSGGGVVFGGALVLLPDFRRTPSLLFLAARILFTMVFAGSSGRPQVLLISVGVHVPAIFSKSSPCR